MLKSSSLGLGALLLASQPAQAQWTLSLPDVLAEPGAVIQVPVNLEILSGDVQGWSFGVNVAPPLQILDAVASPTVQAFDMGSGPSFHALNVLPGEGITTGVITDFFAIELLPTGTHALCIMEIEVPATANVGDSFPLTFTSSLGDPPVDIVIALPGGTSAFPILEDGSITIAFTNYCNGDGGVSPDCTSCPCGNDAPAGTLGGCLNSAGTSGRLLPSGQPSVMNDTLSFTAAACSPNTFAVLISGDNQLPNNPANPCFGLASGVQSIQLDGLRCAGGGVVRHGARPTDGNGDVGVTTNRWGPPAGPPGGLIAQGGFSSGQTRNFQVFYREFVDQVCQTGQNTSDAATITFAP